MDEDPFGNAPIPKGSIATHSRVKAWWLRVFRGYRVLTTHQRPKQNVFGELYFTAEYILEKRK